MRTNRFLVILMFLVGLICSQASAFDGVLPESKLFPTQQRIFAAVANYWVIQDLYSKYIEDPSAENEANWNAAIKSQTKISVKLGKSVLVSTKNNQYGELEMLSDIFKSLPDGAKNALYPTLGYIKFEITHKTDEFLTEEKFREYFPGYGYSEPGFKYRKGRELDREYKGVTWILEEQSISSTWNVSLTVSIDLLNILSGMVTGGMIKNLKVSEQFNMNVNGTPMIVANVSFQRIKSIVTKTNRKFEINKVWFELLRTKSSSSSSNAVWENTGKTYEILQELTGEEVVTGIEGK